jgi:hypothetical protein
MSNPLVRIAAAALILLALAAPSAAQRSGDYLTAGELDLVRDVRQIDVRTMVFMTVANRRLLALADPNAEPKEKRFGPKFGPLQKGTQVELLDDYRRTLDELMVKLDDEFERGGLTGDLRKALEMVVLETERQMKEIEGLRPKLTETDADRFARKALEVARELHDGSKKALDASPAPAKN